MKQTNDNLVKINFEEDGIYRVKDGIFEKVKTPETGFGKQIINWQDGKVKHCEISFTEN